jgi:hypothetical protein
MKFKRITRKRGCPECGGSDEYRVRREGMYVKVVSAILNVRPHYCPSCDVYFFAPRHSQQAQTGGKPPTESLRTQKRPNHQLRPRSLTH